MRTYHLPNAWPAFQVDYPGLVQYTRSDSRPNAENLRLWCGTPVSYHHMSATMVEEMWEFEQDWIAHNNAVSIAKPPADHPARKISIVR